MTATYFSPFAFCFCFLSICIPSFRIAALPDLNFSFSVYLRVS